MNIKASWDFDDHNGSQLSGAVYQDSATYSGGFKNEGEAARKLIFDASRAWTGSSSSANTSTESLGSASAIQITPQYIDIKLWKRLT